jgi:hypothetical protein
VKYDRIGTFQTPSKWVALCKSGTGTSENPTTEADVLDLLILPGTIPARVLTAGRRG